MEFLKRITNKFVKQPNPTTTPVIIEASDISTPIKLSETGLTAKEPEVVPIAPVILPAATPTVETVDTATVKEKPSKPFDFLVVTADDDEYQAKSNAFSTDSVIKAQSRANGGVVVATGSKDLFERVFDYKDGKQADVVLLDNRFDINQAVWEINEHTVAPWLNRHGFDVNKKLINWCENVNGTKLGILLRAAGFTGKLFYVSGDPDEPHQIESKMESFGQATGIALKTLPFDGYTTKRSIADIMIRWSDEIDGDRNWIKKFFKGKEVSIFDTLDLLMKD